MFYTRNFESRNSKVVMPPIVACNRTRKMVAVIFLPNAGFRRENGNPEFPFLMHTTNKVPYSLTVTRDNKLSAF